MSACFEAEGYGPGGTCPFCGARAETVHEEIAHMEARHPDVIERRLREAGIEPPRPADRLADLDHWAESHNANVLLARRLDLTCPEEWSCILTWAGLDGKTRQAKGTSMHPALAVERSLAEAREGGTMADE